MKKSFLFLCTMLCSLAMNAQLVSSHSASLTRTPKAPSRTTWMVRLGVGSNTFTGDDYKKLDSKVGYFFGFEFNKSIRQRGAYWGMDFDLTSRGYAVEDYYKYTAHTFQWSPFIFGWKISIPNSKFSIDPHIGVYIAADYAGKFSYEEKKLGDLKIGDIDGYQRVDAGLKIGIGAWYNNKYNIDFTYQRGFVANAEEADGGASNFMFRLGYAF